MSDRPDDEAMLQEDAPDDVEQEQTAPTRYKSARRRTPAELPPPDRAERRAQRAHDSIVDRVNHALWRANRPPL